MKARKVCMYLDNSERVCAPCHHGNNEQSTRTPSFVT